MFLVDDDRRYFHLLGRRVISELSWAEELHRSSFIILVTMVTVMDAISTGVSEWLEGKM